MPPKVITVVLSNNRRDDTLVCLQTLSQSTYSPHSIIVVDNVSKDGTVEAIRTQFPEAGVVELTQNLGYAGNNNVGIRLALEQGADWVFVLNDDTAVAPDCIAELMRIAESADSIGMVGPMIYHFDERNVIQTAGGRADGLWRFTHLGHNEDDIGQFPGPHLVDWLSGCALLVKRAVIEQIGLLDERLFMYWEEIDWCLRASRHQWRLMHMPQARMWHKGVQRHYQPTPAVTYYSTRNQFLILQKHQAPVGVIVYHWLQSARIIVSWTVRPKWRHLRVHRDAMLAGLVDYVRQRWGMRVL
jgi:hypothetical protein